MERQAFHFNQKRRSQWFLLPLGVAACLSLIYVPEGTGSLQDSVGHLLGWVGLALVGLTQIVTWKLSRRRGEAVVLDEHGVTDRTLGIREASWPGVRSPPFAGSARPAGKPWSWRASTWKRCSPAKPVRFGACAKSCGIGVALSAHLLDCTLNQLEAALPSKWERKRA